MSSGDGDHRRKIISTSQPIGTPPLQLPKIHFHDNANTFTPITPTTTTMPPKTKPKIPQTIAGLLVLPLSLPPQKVLPNSTATQTHYLYLRPDAPKTPNPDTPRSLFLANVPVDADESSLRSLFKELCGSIVERVEFEG